MNNKKIQLLKTWAREGHINETKALDTIKRMIDQNKLTSLESMKVWN